MHGSHCGMQDSGCGLTNELNTAIYGACSAFNFYRLVREVSWPARPHWLEGQSQVTDTTLPPQLGGFRTILHFSTFTLMMLMTTSAKISPDRGRSGTR